MCVSDFLVLLTGIWKCIMLKYCGKCFKVVVKFKDKVKETVKSVFFLSLSDGNPPIPHRSSTLKPLLSLLSPNPTHFFLTFSPFLLTPNPSPSLSPFPSFPPPAHRRANQPRRRFARPARAGVLRCLQRHEFNARRGQQPRIPHLHLPPH